MPLSNDYPIKAESEYTKYNIYVIVKFLCAAENNKRYFASPGADRGMYTWVYNALSMNKAQS